MCPWFSVRFWCYNCYLLVYIVCFPTYPFFFTFSFLTSSLIFSFLLRFQSVCCKWRLNLALFFAFIFVMYYVSFDCWMHAFVVFMFFQEIGSGKRLRYDIFCVERDAKPQLNQSINRHWWWLCVGWQRPTECYSDVCGHFRLHGNQATIIGTHSSGYQQRVSQWDPHCSHHRHVRNSLPLL